MKTQEAFSFFVQRILLGEEGVFWSERDAKGKENWVFGVGKKKRADFEKGPFPLFSLTSFLGDEKHWVHFEEWYSSDKCTDLLVGDRYICPLQDTKIELPKNLESCSNETLESFCQKVEQVKKYAHDGDLWVLNLAHELSGEFVDESALLSAFVRFLGLKKSHAGGVWWATEQKMCSFSPEVFLRQEGRNISTFPIKGTGTKEYLQRSEKEIAELLMVTDLLRNDLGQIARKVWMGRERVLTDCGNFYHAHAEIFAELSTEVLRWEDYHRLLPCGSISGAPKKRIVEKIQALESFDRGFYTGTFGIKRDAEHFISNILIRTLFGEKGRWKFPVGAGLTCESDALFEWEETLQKAEILRQCVKETLIKY